MFNERDLYSHTPFISTSAHYPISTFPYSFPHLPHFHIIPLAFSYSLRKLFTGFINAALTD